MLRVGRPLGLFGFIHPEHHTLRGGVGPTFGMGVQAGSLQFGASATWSPPPLHGEPRPGSTHILMGGLTIGFTN